MPVRFPKYLSDSLRVPKYYFGTLWAPWKLFPKTMVCPKPSRRTNHRHEFHNTTLWTILALWAAPQSDELGCNLAWFRTENKHPRALKVVFGIVVERILKSFGLDFAFNCQNWVSWKPWLAPRVKGLDGLIKTVIFEFQTYSLNIRIQLGGTSASFWDEEHHLLPKISKNAAAKSPGPSPTVTPPHSYLTHTGKDEAWPSDLSSKNRTNLKKKHLNKYDPKTYWHWNIFC